MISDHQDWNVKCSTCGNEVEMIEDKENCIWHIKCEHCERSYEELETKYDVLKGNWERLLKMYLRINKCYSDLQDHLKCILTK